MSWFKACSRWSFGLVMVIALGYLSAGGDTVKEKPPAEAQQIEALRAENEALRRENQQLRRELVAKNAGEPGSALPIRAQDVAGRPQETKAADTGFWISAKSHIRHNSKCRNYRQVKGYPCGPGDGKPCKACGG